MKALGGTEQAALAAVVDEIIEETLTVPTIAPRTAAASTV